MSLNPDLYYGQRGDSDICIRIRPYKLSAPKGSSEPDLTRVPGVSSPYSTALTQLPWGLRL